MPAIVVRSREGTAYHVDLSSRPITLGRADTCDLVLRNDAEVSREHVRIWLDDQQRVIVADNNSKNGTRVDEGEIFRDEQRVAYETIQLGDHEVEIVGAAAGPPDSTVTVAFAADNETRLGDTRFFPSSKRVDLNARRLAKLIALTERIGAAFEKKQMLEQALDACCETLGFERGLVVLKTPRGEPEPPITFNVETDENGAYKVSRTLINRALIHGERAVVNNPATDLGGNLSESLVRFPIQSALCVPILHRDEVLGAIYGDRITQASTYEPDDVDFLASIAQQVGVGIANLRLLRDHVLTQKVYAELEQARVIQQQLLPSAPISAGRVRVEGYNCASSEVGGDYFDCFNLDDDRLGLVIADVTGHGLPAAIMMANLQAAIHVALTGESALPELVSRVNRLICRNTSPYVFITAIIGMIHTETGRIEYVNAGHPGPILIQGGTARAVEEENSLPLGVEEDEKYVVRTIEPGDELDAVLLYTDGLTEAASEEGPMLGLPPILRALETASETAPKALIQAALWAMEDHLDGAKNADDMTLLAVQFHK